MTEPETAVAATGIDEEATATAVAVEPPGGAVEDVPEVEAASAVAGLRLAPEPGPANPSPDGTWLS